ncbi:glycerate kinase-like protein [Plakobranchus ocellatus]|uniref:Glycerate kinase n=1 Tax=Plakobranchus ocellatus TaxID=259542 RepID=A0AAV4DL40_9GAST|nr:glycerate kinase-like protein [Plakobranchus ocellatus]
MRFSKLLLQKGFQSPLAKAAFLDSSKLHVTLLQKKPELVCKQSLHDTSRHSRIFSSSQQRAFSTGSLYQIFYQDKVNQAVNVEAYRRSDCQSFMHAGSMSYSTSVSDRQASGSQGSEQQTMNVGREIFSHAVSSVLPHQMIQKNLIYDSTTSSLRVASREYQLKQNIHVVGFGKAVLGMARALEDCVGDHMVSGIVSIPVGSRDALEKAGLHDMLLLPSSKIRVMEGAANNLPDEASRQAALEIQRVVEAVGANDILVVLISGGGSALLTAPEEPLTLDDILTVTRVLSRSGVNIMDLNMVRKQLDRLKGGGIAKLAHPAQVISLLLSDIIGDDLDFIASSPTVRNSSTPQDCLDLFSRYGVKASIPASVMSYLEGKIGSSEGMAEQDFSHVQNVLIGTNKIACEAACQKGSTSGFLPYVLSTELSGEAKSVGSMFAFLAKFIVESFDAADQQAGSSSGPADAGSVKDKLLTRFSMSESSLREIASLVQQVKQSKSARGVCIVAGGETTVTVKGKGKGGRNQEMATSAGLQLHELFSERSDAGGLSSQDVVFLSAGTDGQDGPTTAAGGVVDIDFVHQAKEAGLDIQKYLDNNDSFTLLSQLNSGSNFVITGLTGTNVMDIQVLLVQLRHL